MSSVNKGRKGINHFTVQENIKPYKVGFLICGIIIIKGGIAFGYAFKLVVEIKNNFSQGHLKSKFHPVSCEIYLIFQNPSFINAKCHDRPYVFRKCNYLGADIRLF